MTEHAQDANGELVSIHDALAARRLARDTNRPDPRFFDIAYGERRIPRNGAQTPLVTRRPHFYLNPKNQSSKRFQRRDQKIEALSCYFQKHGYKTNIAQVQQINPYDFYQAVGRDLDSVVLAKKDHQDHALLFITDPHSQRLDRLVNLLKSKGHKQYENKGKGEQIFLPLNFSRTPSILPILDASHLQLSPDHYNQPYMRISDWMHELLLTKYMPNFNQLSFFSGDSVFSVHLGFDNHQCPYSQTRGENTLFGNPYCRPFRKQEHEHIRIAPINGTKFSYIE
ncbi:MAG: hypothetical protein ACMXYF_01955 [Candidatus Woesearchaeota archaeon]